ncbi:hypothetical protein RYX36_019389, partial [Vicia faba]
HSFLTCKSNLALSLYCASTYVHNHLSQSPQSYSKMIHKYFELKPITNSYGVKILGTPRVFESINRANKQNDVHNVIPLHMTIPLGISKNNIKHFYVKNDSTKKRVRTFVQETYVHDIEKEIEDIDAYTTENDVESIEINLDENFEPNVEPSSTTFGEPLDKPHANPTFENSKVDIHVFNPYVNEILHKSDYSYEYLRNENPKNKKFDCLSKRSEKDSEDDDIPIANIMKRIIE